MNKKILLIFLSLIILNFSVVFGEDNLNKPALILRFNKPNIYYENSLDMLVKKVLNTKLDAKFYLDLLSNNDRELDNLLNESLNITAKLEEAGIAKKHIFIRKNIDANINFSEIYISVN